MLKEKSSGTDAELEERQKSCQLEMEACCQSYTLLCFLASRRFLSAVSSPLIGSEQKTKMGDTLGTTATTPPS